MPLEINVESLYRGILSADRASISKAITLVESRNSAHRVLAAQLLDLCTKQQSETFRFAISGSPGVGKSTFIEQLGSEIIKSNERLAVLAIDPSSRLAGGSILGDKTRMTSLSNHPSVFVRPTAARDQLGGVAERTRDSITICEAAGFQNICVETVGVGQSEVEVQQMVDFFLLLIGPGAGDDLQGIKRGIVEIADGILINKTDGAQRDLALQTKQHYQRAIHTYPKKSYGLTPFVLNCSAIEQDGITEVWEKLQSFNSAIITSGFKESQRQQQDVIWLDAMTKSELIHLLSNDTAFQSTRSRMVENIISRKMSPASAYLQLKELIDQMFKR